MSSGVMSGYSLTKMEYSWNESSFISPIAVERNCSIPRREMVCSTDSLVVAPINFINVILSLHCQAPFSVFSNISNLSSFVVTSISFSLFLFIAFASNVILRSPVLYSLPSTSSPDNKSFI